MEKWTRLLVVVATWILILVLLAGLIRLTLYIQHTVLLFALGMLLAYALDPVVEALRKRTQMTIAGRSRVLSRSGAVGIVFVLLVAIVVVGIVALSRPAMHQFKLLEDRRLQTQYRQEAIGGMLWIDRQLKILHVNRSVQDYIHDPSSLPPSVKAAESSIERSTVIFLGDIAVSLGETLIVLLITVYLLIYSGEMKRKFNEMLPDALLTYAMVWEEDVNRILGGFVRGQLTISIALAITSALACAIVGIKFWLLIGLFVLGASLIPVFGPYIGAAPAILLALLTPTHFANRIVAAVVLLVIFVTINEAASKILYPRLVGKAIGLHEVLVLFVLFAGLEIGGVVGVLFAAPVTAIAFATIVHLYRFWQNLPDSLIFNGANTRKVLPNPPVTQGTAD
jgi:predicted PurR-regulated permease PerM